MIAEAGLAALWLAAALAALQLALALGAGGPEGRAIGTIRAVAITAWPSRNRSGRILS